MNGAVGNRGEALIVSDDDKGLAEFVAKVEEQLVKFFLVLSVERSRWFIGQDDSRIVDQRTGHSHTLFLTTREFVGFVGGAIGQSHKLQQLLGTLLSLLRRSACNISWNHDILDGSKLGQQLVELEHKTQMLVAEIGQFLSRQATGVDAINNHLSAIGTVERTDNLQQGGLTGSAGANDTYHLALVDMKVDAF